MKQLFALVLAAACLAGPAHAQVLTFEGIGDQVAIGNFYTGGSGPNFGIDFFGNALAINSQVNGCNGTGNFAQQPSGCGALFFLEGSATGMNRAAGFTSGFSLFYTAAFNAGSLQVFDGLNGTGALLGSLALPVTGNGSGTAGCFGTNFCPWTAKGLGFAGTAKSILFSGVGNQIAFDNVTFGSSTPGSVVPEPATMTLLATGLAGMAGAGLRRRRKKA